MVAKAVMHSTAQSSAANTERKCLFLVIGHVLLFVIGGFHGRRVICAAAQEIHQLVAAHAHRADKIDDFKVLLLGALGFQLFQPVLVLGDFAAGLFDLTVNAVILLIAIG